MTIKMGIWESDGGFYGCPIKRMVLLLFALLLDKNKRAKRDKFDF